MVNFITRGRFQVWEGGRRTNVNKFKFISPSLTLLFLLAFQFTLLSSSEVDGFQDDSETKIKCSLDACHLRISSGQEALQKMIVAHSQLYEKYATVRNGSKGIDRHGLEKFMTEVGLIKDPHAGHGHDHAHMTKDDFDISKFADFFYDYEYDDDEESNSTSNQTLTRKKRSEDELPCVKSVNDLAKSYFSTSEIHLTMDDLTTLLPQILLDLRRSECRIVKDDHHDKEDSKEKTPSSTIWLISFGCVFLISVVSLIGVLAIPLLRHSKLLNVTISFLVALAVGTLSGDALLHLLPHSSGLHDHSGGGHDHGGHDHSGHGHGDGEGEDDHFNMMWKGLMACAGIYLFYIMEAVMGIIRRKKSRTNGHLHDPEKCGMESPSTSVPAGTDLKTNKDDLAVPASPTQSPLINAEKNNHGPTVKCEEGEEEVIIDTGHHHHHHNKVPKTIASLAWMIIVGDGLHNITDGLAIGAAFSSSVGTGLGTSLAIFCHELPQEIADFAILLNCGMTVKQAIFWNFLSALTCFLGLLIGLLVGEYTSGIILWILAFTAGGFLYIALVGMLPAMMKQLEQDDYLRNFIIQNIGMITGFTIMVVIALREEAFIGLF